MGKKTEKLEIVWRAPESLIPYIKNAKLHTVEQVDKIAGQIAAFGFDQPIVVDKEGVIIKGHGRREAALRLHMKEVPVIVSTLDEYQAIAARIGDNKVAEAPWDLELLKFDLGSLDLQNFDLNLTGMEELDLKKLLEPEEIEREQGKGIEDFAESHEETDIRQIILIMTADEFDPILRGLMKLQTEEKLDNNTEAVKFLLDFYENNRSEKTES